MKKYVFLAFFALIAFVVKAQDESGDLVKEGQQMPAFTIMNDNGTAGTFFFFEGKSDLGKFFCNLVSSLSEGACRGAKDALAEV